MNKEIVPADQIALRIRNFRVEKVLLDFDLAALYGVETRVLNQAVKRNADRFPSDFMFQLSVEETEIISQRVTSSTGQTVSDSSQIVMSSAKHRGKRYRPYAFSEQGVAMLSSVLNSERAIKVNIAIMRAFVKLRQILETNRELAKKFSELERRVGKHDEEIDAIFEAIRRVNAHDRLDDLHHVRGRSAAAAFAARVCAVDRASYNSCRIGFGSHRVGSHANCRSCTLQNDRAGAMGACPRNELPSGDRRRQPHDGPCHGYFRPKYRVVFMGRRTSAERIFLLVAARCGWLLRSFSERGFVSVLRVLRAGSRAEVFSYRRLRIDQQGIRGDEADALFVFWRHARIHRDSHRIRNCRVAGSKSVVAIPIFAATAIVGVSRVISRLCCARGNLAAAHVGAD